MKEELVKVQAKEDKDEPLKSEVGQKRLREEGNAAPNNRSA